MGIERLDMVMDENVGKKSTLDTIEDRENSKSMEETSAKLHDYLEQLGRIAGAQEALKSAEEKGIPGDRLVAILEKEQAKAHAVLEDVLGSSFAEEAVEKLKNELREQNRKNLEQGVGGEEIFDRYFKALADVEDKLKG